MLHRTLKAVFWFMVGVALVAVPMLARAETIPATSSTVPAQTLWKYCWGTGCQTSFTYESAAAAAAGVGAIRTSNGYYPTATKLPGVYSDAACTQSTFVYNTQVFTKWLKADGVNTHCLGLGDYVMSGQACTSGTLSGGQCVGALSCPSGQNWTLSGSSCTRPDCVAPQVRDSADGVCKAPPCPSSGTSYSSGIYDIGTSPTGRLQTVGCTSGGCDVTITEGTSPVASRIVNGVTHYYGRAGYAYTGETCTPGSTSDVGAGLTQPPSDTCGAGQGKASMNGKTICIDDAGQPVNTQAPTTTNNGSSSSTTTNGDGTTSTSGTTSSTTCTGDTCTTTTTTNTNGGSGAGGTTNTTTQSQSKSDFCAQNPGNSQCQATQDDEEDEITAGDGAEVDDLYTKGERTVGQVFSEFGTKVRNAGFFTGAANFFTVSVPSGACTDLSGTFDYGLGQMTVDMTPVFCGSMANSMYGVLSIGVMIAALWVAFRIALL